MEMKITLCVTLLFLPVVMNNAVRELNHDRVYRVISQLIQVGKAEVQVSTFPRRTNAVADPGFPRGVVNRAPTYYLTNFFSETCLEMKTFWPRGKMHIPCAPWIFTMTYGCSPKMLRAGRVYAHRCTPTTGTPIKTEGYTGTCMHVKVYIGGSQGSQRCTRPGSNFFVFVVVLMHFFEKII